MAGTETTTSDRLTGSVAAGPLRLLQIAWESTVKDPIVDGLARAGVTPNQVTVTATILTLGCAPLAATGHYTAAGIVYMLGCIGDLIDGSLARKIGKSSKFGAFLDSTLDRVVEAVILISVGIGLGSLEGYIVTFLLLTSSLLFSYVKARAECLGVSIEVRWMQRADRILWVAVTLLVAPLVARFWHYPAHELIIASFSICVGFAVVGVALRFKEAYVKLTAIQKSSA